MGEAPFLSIQIVTWNSADVIEACLESLCAQTLRAFEAIVVDNASQDDTRERVARVFAKGLDGTLILSERNSGFCGGQNRALASGSAPWVFFLNPDTALPPDFVSQAKEVVANLDPEVGTVAPLILRSDGRVDSSGLFLDQMRRVFDRGQGGPRNPLASPEDIFGCTGAAALHRRAMLLDVAEMGQVLDERLFAYFDDLDLSWRAQLRGWRCRFVPSLVVTHARAGRNAIRPVEGRPGRSWEQRLVLRNRLLVLLKCERGYDALAALPWLLPYELLRLFYVAFRAPGALVGYLDALRLAPSILRSRRYLQERSRPARLLRAPFFPHLPRDPA
jgi:GT2 family glycosyltransferase